MKNNSERDANCIFCKIVAHELPSTRLFENESTIALVTIQPSSYGHTLVIPKVHSKNIFEISSHDWAAVQETVRVVAKTLEQKLNADGINIAMNNREHAGQIIDHVHVHIIPRYKNDGLQPFSHRSLKDGEAEEVAAKMAH